MSSDSNVASTDAQPGDAPKDLCLGCINPRALVEAILGRQIKWHEINDAQLISDVLGREYNELFDMKNGSPLYAGAKLGENNMAVRASSSDIKVVEGHDLATPNLGVLKKLQDLKIVGVKDTGSLPITRAWLTNGKLNLQLDVPALNKTITNLRLTKTIANLTISDPSKGEGAPGEWNPANCFWRDVGDFLKDVTEMDDPTQGALADCWLIAALSAVAWALPYSIVHRTRSTGMSDNDHVSLLTFYSKGYGRDAPTGSVEVTDAVLVNASNSILFARSRDAGELWPALYEKAFAKWASKNGTDRPDLTTLNYGDCTLASAQLTNRKPTYYYTSNNTPDQLWGLVRANSIGGKTFNPMTAWTPATADGTDYIGPNIVANHCYTILGWTFVNSKQYIVLRNPWGWKEPVGSNTIQGVVSFFDRTFWRPINLISNDGIFALDAVDFKKYFGGIGVAVL